MLIKCLECELQVSDKAVACPHCGYPLKPASKSRANRKTNRRRRLPNGFGQISEIKNRNLRKPFRAMVTVGKTSTGRPICKPLEPEAYFTTYNDAYAALVEYNRNPHDLSPSVTLKEIYERWSERHFQTLSSKSTINVIKASWSYCSSIYDMRVSDIRGRHIKSCIDEGTKIVRGEERQPTAEMKKKIKSVLNQILDYAVEYEIVERNYARNFTLPADVKKEIATAKNEHMSFTEDEIQALWNNVTKIWGVDLMLIQCYSGWRPGELGLIEYDNVDLGNWTFKGGIKTEAGMNRIVPIHSRIRHLVTQRYNEAKAIGSKYVFNRAGVDESDKKKSLTYEVYKKTFHTIREELNLDPRHRPHDGRTHFVTTAKKYRVDEYAIKYMVGHSITDITEKVYTKRELDWLKDEIEKIK